MTTKQKANPELSEGNRLNGNAVPSNLPELNVPGLTGRATLGNFFWQIVTDELDCCGRLREVLELTDSVELTTWQQLVDSVFPDDVVAFEDAIAGVLTGHNSITVDFRASTPAGLKPLTLYADVYRDNEGIPVYLVGIIRLSNMGASTEQKHYVINLLMETVHAVNNKFTAILGNTAMASNLINEGPANRVFRQYLEEIEHDVLTAAEKLRQLVQTAKRL